MQRAASRLKFDFENKEICISAWLSKENYMATQYVHFRKHKYYGTFCIFLHTQPGLKYCTYSICLIQINAALLPSNYSSLQWQQNTQGYTAIWWYTCDQHELRGDEATPSGRGETKSLLCKSIVSSPNIEIPSVSPKSRLAIWRQASLKKVTTPHN